MLSQDYLRKTPVIYQTWVLLVLVFFAGCEPRGPEFIEDLDVVYTNFNPEFEFNEQSTFAIPDRVVKVESENFAGADGDEPEYVDEEIGNLIIAQIRENLVERGWTEVDREDNPDVILLVSSSARVNLYYYYDWRYWGWWYPGFHPGLTWWYPGYAPRIVTGHRSGSLMVQMVHPNGMGANANVPVMWTGVINGLLQGTREGLVDRLNQTIQQAFVQSPYLEIDN